MINRVKRWDMKSEPAVFWLVAVLFEEIERFGLHPEDQVMVGWSDGLDGLDMYHGDDENVGFCRWFDIVKCHHIFVLEDHTVKRVALDDFTKDTRPAE